MKFTGARLRKTWHIARQDPEAAEAAKERMGHSTQGMLIRKRFWNAPSWVAL